MADAESTEIVKTETTELATTSSPSFVLARIKPFNPKAGLKVRTYTYKGVRFREEAGWYRIPVELGEELKSVVADESDPYAPFLFDVLSEVEAQKVEELEMRRRERATALRPNASPDLRRSDTRRLASAAQTARSNRDGSAGVVTTSALRAPNDEEIPNGYPPARSYPMPREGGTYGTGTQNFDAKAFETDHDDELVDAAKQAGVDDKTLGATAANLHRDMNGLAPVLIDGQGTEDDDDFNLEGTDTNFGPDPVEGQDRPASPPSARRRKRGG